MIDLMELFRHWHAGRSQVQIAEALDIDRETIRKYLAPAVAAGLTPGAGGKFDGQLTASVTVATIAQRLRDDHGVAVSESTVRRYVAAQFAEKVAESKVTVARGAVPPGDEAQVDYGKLGMWRNPATDRRVAVWAFAIIL